MSQNFVRGSQTAYHMIRMLKQSFKLTLGFCFTILLVCAVYYLYSQEETFPFRPSLFGTYLKSRGAVFVKQPERPIHILNEYNREIEFGALEYKHWYENIIAPHLKQKTIESFYYGLRISSVAFFILLFIMYINGLHLNKTRHSKGIPFTKRYRLKLRIFFYNLLKLNFNTIKLGNVSYPKNAEKTHTLITGASGTGKTVLMSNLMYQARKKNHKGIIYDKMGVYTERFYDPEHGDILLNPLDDRSPNWSLINECRKTSDFDTAAKALIPSKAKGDPFWENAARTVFAEVIGYLKRNNRVGNKDLQDTFLAKDGKEFQKIIKSSGILQRLLPDESEKTSAGILAVMMESVKSLKHLCTDDSKEQFSIKDWINDTEKTGFLIISSRADQHETLKPLISVYLETAINSLLSLDQNKSRRIWLFLDELPSLHYIPSLQSGLAESRQFGGSFVLSLQLMAQLRDIYGKDKAESVSGLCRNRAVFATPDEETANWCAGSLGKIEEEVIRENFSYGSHEMRDGVSLNRHSQLKNIVYPSEIMNLEDLNCYIRFSNGFPVSKTELNYTDYEEIAKRFEELKPPQPEQLKISKSDLAEESSKDTEEKPLEDPKKSNKKTVTEATKKEETTDKENPEEQKSEKISLSEEEVERLEAEAERIRHLSPAEKRELFMGHKFRPVFYHDPNKKMFLPAIGKDSKTSLYMSDDPNRGEKMRKVWEKEELERLEAKAKSLETEEKIINDKSLSNEPLEDLEKESENKQDNKKDDENESYDF